MMDINLAFEGLADNDPVFLSLRILNKHSDYWYTCVFIGSKQHVSGTQWVTLCDENDVELWPRRGQRARAQGSVLYYHMCTLHLT